MSSKTLVVLCTLPDQEIAARIANTLVKEQLAACINIVPGLVSVYRWQGAVQQDNEVLLLIKTISAIYPQLEQRIRTLHPYELPEIIAVPLQTGQADYLQWINNSLIPSS
jgi:periplasmic divalent cation tolerance protein